MQKTEKNLTVVLPTYNESGNILPLIDDVLMHCGDRILKIIVVDDASPDGTARKVREKFYNNQKIKLINRKERGLAGAILTGMKEADKGKIAVMDTDFNHDPEILLKMLKLSENYDLVVGSRYVKTGGMENKFRNIASKNYNFIIRMILKIPVHDALSGFFIIDSEKVKPFLKPEIFNGYGEYFLRLIVVANRKGLTMTEIPVFYKNRKWGKSKSKFIKMFIEYSKVIAEIYRS